MVSLRGKSLLSIGGRLVPPFQNRMIMSLRFSVVPERRLVFRDQRAIFWRQTNSADRRFFWRKFKARLRYFLTYNLLSGLNFCSADLWRTSTVSVMRTEICADEKKWDGNWKIFRPSDLLPVCPVLRDRCQSQIHPIQTVRAFTARLCRPHDHLPRTRASPGSSRLRQESGTFLPSPTVNTCCSAAVLPRNIP